jgi:hypothetical protein
LFDQIFGGLEESRDNTQELSEEERFGTIIKGIPID